MDKINYNLFLTLIFSLVKLLNTKWNSINYFHVVAYGYKKAIQFLVTKIFCLHL